VLKAYRELEHRGPRGRPAGPGTFIDGTLRRVGLAQQAELRKTLMTWLRSAATAGLDEAGIAAVFSSSLRDFSDAAVPPPGRGARGAARPGGAARRR
jgi:GntR family transcriptional regulator